MHGMATTSEVQRLRDRIEELESLLGLEPDDSETFAVLRLPGVCRKLLGILLKRKLVTRDAAHTVIYGGLPESSQPALRGLDVHATRLRQRLRPHEIELKTEWGVGWYLTPADKAKIAALIGAVPE